MDGAQGNDWKPQYAAHFSCEEGLSGGPAGGYSSGMYHAGNGGTMDGLGGNAGMLYGGGGGGGGVYFATHGGHGAGGVVVLVFTSTSSAIDVKSASTFSSCASA